MGKVRAPHKVKLFVGLISNDTELLKSIIPFLEKKLKNKADFKSELLDFSFTDYYNDEMGSGLKRRFLALKKTVSLENIHKFKILTNKIEKKYSVNGKRMINIDPGYIDLSKLVLFSTKDYSHRIHVGNGIFAEITLSYKGKSFTPCELTYPDYRTSAYISIFNKIRDVYKNSQ